MIAPDAERDLRTLASAGLIVGAVVEGLVVILEFTNPFGGDSQLSEAGIELVAWAALFVLSLFIAKSAFSTRRVTSRRTRFLAVLAVFTPVFVLITGEALSFLRFGRW